MTREHEEILAQGFMCGDFEDVAAVWEIGGSFAFVGKHSLADWQGDLFEVSLERVAVMRNRGSLEYYWG